MTVDLHLHTDASDGSAAPEDVVRRAKAVGLTKIAVADHDTLDGIARAVAHGKAIGGIEVIPAIELTVNVGPAPLGNVHLLGYGMSRDTALLAEVARKSRVGKRVQIEKMLEKLRGLGIVLDPAEVGLVEGEDRYVGRNRIAALLVRKGLVKDRMKAFRRWLNPGGSAFVAAQVAPAREAMEAIHTAGGVAVLAHPTDDDLDRHLRPLVELGLDGIELHRPRLQGKLLARTQKVAEKHDLLAGGGSDWHGLFPEVPLGGWKLEPESIAPLLERLGGA